MMGRSSMPKQMMKKGGMAKKKMNMGGMTKMPMMQEGGDVKVPTKEEFDAMTPKQQEARRRAASLNNITLSKEEKAAKKVMKKKMGDKPKKMNMGGMATANKYDKNKKERSREADMQSGELFFDKRPTPKQEPTEDQTDYDISDPAGFNKGGMAKKMNMGGMTSKMSKQKGGNTVIVDPAKKSPKSRMKTSGSGSKMAMMKKGGKVRGYGMARGGKACKMR